MSLTDFYLVCFLVGVLLSVVSFVLGNLHLHLHLPFHIDIPGVGHGAHLHGAHVGGGLHQADLPYINFGTVTAFLAWFGGVGYLLAKHAHFYAFTAVLISIAAGLVGAWLVFSLVGRLLVNHDHPLDPSDYDMIGVLGRVTSTIREDGTGEIVFSQEGTRRASPARTDNGSPLAKGLEVVVTRFERGIAYVRPFEELAQSGTDSSTSSSGQ
jgi:hypothetical protein